MTYANKMTPMMKLLVEPLIPKLETMKPGDSLVLEARNTDHLTQTRSQLYAWFTLTENKRKFRTQQLSPTLLQITCIQTLPMQIRQDVPLSSVETYVRDCLLHTTDEGEARRLCLEALKCAVISDEDVVPIMDEWRKKQGG